MSGAWWQSPNSLARAFVLVVLCFAGNCRTETLATFEGGEVTRLDLQAAALIQSLSNADPLLTPTTDVVFPTTAAIEEKIQWLAFDFIAARIATGQNLEPTAAEKRTLDAQRSRLTTKIYYMERLAPEVARAESRWREELESAYRQNKDRLVDHPTYWFRFIFIGDPDKVPSDWAPFLKTADTVYEKLQAGDNFTSLALQFSRAMPESDRGALVGPMKGNLMEATRKSVLDSLRPGEFSKPFRTNRGYMLVLLERKHEGHVPTADESSATLVSMGLLRRFMPEGVKAAHFDELIETHEITVFPEKLSTDEATSDVVIGRWGDQEFRNADVSRSPLVRRFGTQLESKELEGMIRTLVLDRLQERIVTSELGPANPVYHRASELLSLMQQRGLALDRLSGTNQVPLLSGCKESPSACRAKTLDAFGFKRASEKNRAGFMTKPAHSLHATVMVSSYSTHVHQIQRPA